MWNMAKKNVNTYHSTETQQIDAGESKRNVNESNHEFQNHNLKDLMRSGVIIADLNDGDNFDFVLVIITL